MENRRKWVEALRSGKYKQTRSHLADKNGFCCLGVACEVAIANGVRIKKRADGFGITYATERDSLPRRVQIWLGFGDELDEEAANPWLGNSSCAEQNDEGKSFTEIADMIEQEYLVLNESCRSQQGELFATKGVVSVERKVLEESQSSSRAL